MIIVVIVVFIIMIIVVIMIMIMIMITRCYTRPTKKWLRRDASLKRPRTTAG